MKTRSILYSKEMILAKLAGRKTVTRRPVKDSYVFNHDPDRYKSHGINDKSEALFEDLKEDRPTKWLQPVPCPYGTAGDRLYTKENFEILEYSDVDQSVKIKYKADGHIAWKGLDNTEWEKYSQWKQPIGSKSKLFMFKGLCRFWDEITAINVQRVQDISESEAMAEGINEKDFLRNNGYPIRAFKNIWQSMYEGGPFDWHKNPWVWVVRFEPVREKAEVKSEK